MLNPDTAALSPGDVLVAPVTDVAWTPLFLRAAALVVEVGGPLSHGSIVARDRVAVARATEALRFTAGNFYINDKPTGAVVGQQPFGGARASGTNDKAGSAANLARWTSPRSIKETFVAPLGVNYPHQQD